MNLRRHSTALAILLLAGTFPAKGQTPSQKARPPVSIAATYNATWKMVEADFIAAGDAMPEEKYSFAPADGAFQGVRTFAQQVKHVACANFAFFKEIQGEAPPPDCLNGGPDPAKTKAELMRYLRDSFAYADRVIASINGENILDPVSGPYGGRSTRLGIAVLAVWHASDHYGQVVEYCA